MPFGGLIADLIPIPEGDPVSGWKAVIDKGNAAYAEAYAKHNNKTKEGVK